VWLRPSDWPGQAQLDQLSLDATRCGQVSVLFWLLSLKKMKDLPDRSLKIRERNLEGWPGWFTWGHTSSDKHLPASVGNHLLLFVGVRGTRAFPASWQKWKIGIFVGSAKRCRTSLAYLAARKNHSEVLVWLLWVVQALGDRGGVEVPFSTGCLPCRLLRSEVRSAAPELTAPASKQFFSVLLPVFLCQELGPCSYFAVG
jgi:hypothetical protein